MINSVDKKKICKEFNVKSYNLMAASYFEKEWKFNHLALKKLKTIYLNKKSMLILEIVEKQLFILFNQINFT